MKEKYFVASDDDNPLKIYFNEIDAFVSGYKYIDSFDEIGNKITTYELIDNEYIVDK